MKVLRKAFSHWLVHEGSREGKLSSQAGNLCLLSHFAVGKIKDGLGTRGAQELNHFGDTTMNLIGTEQGEHFEDARTYCFTRDRYTDRVNQYSRLDTPRLGCRTQRRFHRRFIEVLEPGERRVERNEMLAHSLDPYVLVDRGLVV